MIFVVKVYGVKAFKIIVQKVNGIFEITINGQNFDKKPKKPQKNLNLRKLIAIKKNHAYYKFGRRRIYYGNDKRRSQIL